jgi:hypothetical protein
MDKLLSVKELADALGRSETYVRHMKMIGFKMPGGRATVNEAREFMSKHNNPCSEYRKRKQKNNNE